jgi:alpha-L-fucosidase
MTHPATARPVASSLLLTLVFVTIGFAQGVQESQSQRDARMRWWREARFGMFIHWGVYAIPARGEWHMFNHKVPVADYEKYPPQFNPVRFDASSWARLAREAGMKYLVITSKHHDGFCMWDSKVSTYDIIDRTPFKRDPLKELAAACRAEGVTFCLYHSIMDWHHPDAQGERFSRYREEYLKPQIKELITQYGPLGVLWFDGEWISEWTEKDGKDLYAYVRSLQPGIIVNNRVGKGRSGMAGMSRDPDAPGDFGTPEQEIPSTGIEGVDWESCMTMNNNWGFNASDSSWKSARTLVRQLIDIASKGGNYLLNVGPTAQGTIPEESIARLREIGRWMATNSEAIYGTRASPLASTPWGRCTQKALPSGQTRLYLHIFDWPEDGRLKVMGLGTKPAGANFLGPSPTPCPIESEGDTLVLHVGRAAPDPIAPVLALDFDREVISFHPPSLTADVPIFLDHATVEMSTRSPGLEIRYTLDGREPSPSSPQYQSPVVLTRSTIVRARCFFKGRAVSERTDLEVRRVSPQPAQKSVATVPGLSYAYYEGTWDSLPDFRSLTPTEIGRTDNISLSMRRREEYFGLTLQGLIEVPSTALYCFSLTSDDGSSLWIDDIPVVDNDGTHGSEERTGYAPLEKGRHFIELRYFNQTGASALQLAVGEAGKPIVAIPPGALTSMP